MCFGVLNSSYLSLTPPPGEEVNKAGLGVAGSVVFTKIMFAVHRFLWRALRLCSVCLLKKL